MLRVPVVANAIASLLLFQCLIGLSDEAVLPKLHAELFGDDGEAKSRAAVVLIERNDQWSADIVQSRIAELMTLPAIRGKEAEMVGSLMIGHRCQDPDVKKNTLVLWKRLSSKQKASVTTRMRTLFGRDAAHFKQLEISPALRATLTEIAQIDNDDSLRNMMVHLGLGKVPKADAPGLGVVDRLVIDISKAMREGKGRDPQTLGIYKALRQNRKVTYDQIDALDNVLYLHLVDISKKTAQKDDWADFLGSHDFYELWKTVEMLAYVALLSEKKELQCAAVLEDLVVNGIIHIGKNGKIKDTALEQKLVLAARLVSWISRTKRPNSVASLLDSTKLKTIEASPLYLFVQDLKFRDGDSKAQERVMHLGESYAKAAAGLAQGGRNDISFLRMKLVRLPLFNTRDSFIKKYRSCDGVLEKAAKKNPYTRALLSKEFCSQAEILEKGIQDAKGLYELDHQEKTKNGKITKLKQEYQQKKIDLGRFVSGMRDQGALNDRDLFNAYVKAGKDELATVVKGNSVCKMFYHNGRPEDGLTLHAIAFRVGMQERRIIAAAVERHKMYKFTDQFYMRYYMRNKNLDYRYLIAHIAGKIAPGRYFARTMELLEWEKDERCLGQLAQAALRIIRRRPKNSHEVIQLRLLAKADSGAASFYAGLVLKAAGISLEEE